MDQYKMTKNDFIRIRINQLNNEKITVESLINEYLANDPDYPEIMLRNRIKEIDNQILALTNAMEMI